MTSNSSGSRRGAFGIVYVAILAGLSYYGAWREWNLKGRLLQDGVKTDALVTSCEQVSGGSDRLQYTFQLPAAGGMKTVTGEDEGSCGNVGKRIAIRYLPDRPSLSQRDVRWPWFLLLTMGVVFTLCLVPMLFRGLERPFERAFLWVSGYGFAFIVGAYVLIKLTGKTELVRADLEPIVIAALFVNPYNFVLLRELWLGRTRT